MKYKDYFGLCLNIHIAALGICIGGIGGCVLLTAFAAVSLVFLLKYAERDPLKIEGEDAHNP